MVDVVPPRTMPSEAEVHVARSFLTKILRSSMRRNDPSSWPQSWYSSKLKEEETEPSRNQATPVAVWNPKHEARLKESSTEEDKDAQAQLISQFSSLNNMEKLEHPSHPYAPGHHSPTRYISSTEPLFGPGGKGFSCFSSRPSAPVYDTRTSGRKGTSTETIFFKDQGKKPQHAERPRYYQPMLGNRGWEGSLTEDQPASRVSVAGRPSIGPVWQVTEKKSQSPLPVPPLLNDSFAATKVFPYSEDSSSQTNSQRLTETNAQNGLRSHHDKTSEARQICNPLPTKDSLHPNMGGDHNHNQLHLNKLFSLSSSDIRQSYYSQILAHQKQYSDESTFYLQAKAAPPTKTQTVGSYYRSLQDLPSNAFSRKYIRHSTASMAGSPTTQIPGGGGHSRYYSLASKNSLQTAEVQARQGKAEVWRGQTEKPNWINSNQPGLPSFLKTNIKAKHSKPQSQVTYSENKDHNGHTHLGNGLHYDHQASVRSCSSVDTTKRDEGLSDEIKTAFPLHQINDHKVSLSRPQGPWVPQEDHRICPLKTPLLHSLAQESRSLSDRQPTIPSDTSDSTATISGKAKRRSDRYATTLRKEVQQKRAQLQKSRSVATLTCFAEDKEADEWRSTETSGVSFSNTYKDYLKEAQARVLQATSFQRRDLEPSGPEGSVVKTSNERVRGRKCFTQAKRTHSFSEPDKINKVGVEGEPETGSFGGRRGFFEVKPAFSRPILKPSQAKNSNTDLGETDKPIKRTSTKQPDEANLSADPNPLSQGHKLVVAEQQRLGTFAEYQATWNKKRSLEAKAQGRFHSAENILDTDLEEKGICIHERSRSSPSADFCTQNIPSSRRDSQDQQSSSNIRAKVESRQEHQPDHSPPSVPFKEDLVLLDHRTKPNTADPSHTTLSLGPLTLSPNPDCQHPAQPPQTAGVLPSPKSHLGPQTTFSSQEFLAGAQADPDQLQSVSSSGSDTQHPAATPGFSTGPTPASSPHFSKTCGPDMSGKGGEETEQENVVLSLPSDQTPSPQFSPLRLTDKPPAASVQDDLPLRSDNDWKTAEVTDVNSVVRKVPIRIVHAETDPHQKGRAYLHQNTEACNILEPPPFVTSLGAMCSTSSLFSVCSRQDTNEGSAQVTAQESPPESRPAGVQCSEEDAKREELVRHVMVKDRSLVDILNQSGRKTTMDMMQGLFPPEEQILEGAQQRRRTSAGPRLPTSSPMGTERKEDNDVSASAAASLVPSSSYYNTSAPKAELLIKMKDMQEQLEEQDSEDELDMDLANTKQELISSLARKLEVLWEARHSLQEDVEDNEALGREVEATVQRLCQPNQLDKFRMFVGDLDKVVSLLLSLSGRLARVENALNSLEDEAPPEDKRTLTEKRKLLMRQHEDAKELKENLDRREQLVSSIMEAHLDAESLDDYRHFVKMKSALIIEQRKLEDKIKLGEEQLKCLVDSLPLEQRPLS